MENNYGKWKIGPFSTKNLFWDYLPFTTAGI